VIIAWFGLAKLFINRDWMRAIHAGRQIPY